MTTNKQLQSNRYTVFMERILRVKAQELVVRDGHRSFSALVRHLIIQELGKKKGARE